MISCCYSSCAPGRWVSFAYLLPLLLSATTIAQAAEAEPKRALVLVGPSSHPPETHEVEAGGRLVKHCLETMSGVDPFQVTVAKEWPEQSDLAQYGTVVFLGDMFPLTRLPEEESNMAELSAMMDRGCGIVCVHYATGLEAKDVGPNGEHPLLGWLGGYFATRCQHHHSVARVFDSATINPASPQHPISRGWSSFTLHDEPYINNYFGPSDNRMAAGVFALATSMLPPEEPKKQVVAWGTERADGGRGFAIVMPHFYRNWQVDELRKFILNGIVWTAHAKIPPGGVETELPDLSSFQLSSSKP